MNYEEAKIQLLYLETRSAALGSIQTIDIERTKTNREVKAVEFEYTRKVSRLFDRIMRLKRDEPHLQIQDLRPLFDQRVSRMIRSATEKIYKLGAVYVGRVLKEEEIFLTLPNVSKIEELSNESNDFFWSQVATQIDSKEAKEHFEETKEFITNQGISDDPQIYRKTNPLLRWYGQDPAIDLIMNNIITTPLAIGTIDKMKELKPTIDDTNLLHGKIVFVTRRDEQVCFICALLDYKKSGIEWEIDDPFIIIPRRMTHRRCRCRLMIKLGDRLFSM
jgi:hypothetical protein